VVAFFPSPVDNQRGLQPSPSSNCSLENSPVGENLFSFLSDLRVLVIVYRHSLTFRHPPRLVGPPLLSYQAGPNLFLERARKRRSRSFCDCRACPVSDILTSEFFSRFLMKILRTVDGIFSLSLVPQLDFSSCRAHWPYFSQRRSSQFNPPLPSRPRLLLGPVIMGFFVGAGFFCRASGWSFVF